MDIKDLLEKPLHELSDEELIKRLNLLRRMKVVRVEKAPSKKSNADRRLEDLMAKLPEEKREEVSKLLKYYLNKED